MVSGWVFSFMPKVIDADEWADERADERADEWADE